MPDWLVAESLAPSIEGHLAPLYEGGARGDLTLPFCSACDHPLELDQLRCARCGTAEIDWRPVDRHGIVHSVTTVHRREPGLIEVAEPYHVLDVELTSGHRVIMTTAAPTAAAPVIGAPLAVVFRHVGGVPVPAAEITPRPSDNQAADHLEVVP